jgi:hypothetical protein
MSWRQQLDSGAVTTQAEIARRERLSRARVTQIMNLLQLAPAIQRRLLGRNHTRTTERELRPVVQLRDHAKQAEWFERLGRRADERRLETAKGNH